MCFSRETRWVIASHKTPSPIESTQEGTMKGETDRIAFKCPSLNGLQVLADDIRNIYLQTPSFEKHYVTCGAEFRLENIGKIELIRRDFLW